MSYTLLQFCQYAADEIGINRPTMVVGSTQPEVQKLYRYANKMGNLIMKSYAWQELRGEQTFPALGQQTQTGILPSGFDRIVAETFWNVSQTVNIAGPQKDVDWQSLVARNVNDPTQAYFIYRGNAILVYPIPNANDSLTFIYVTENYVLDGDTTAPKDAFTKDTDTTVLDDELLLQGIIFEYLDNDGQPSANAYTKYDARFQLLTNNDQPTATILQSADIFGRFSRHLGGAPGPNNVQGLV